MVHLIHIFGSAYQRLLLNFLIFFKRERLLFLSDSSPHEEVIYIVGIILFCFLATAKLFFVLCSENRPFPGFKSSHFENETKCKTFLVKMTCICIRIKNRFHIKSFALSLTLKLRLRVLHDLAYLR